MEYLFIVFIVAAISMRFIAAMNHANYLKIIKKDFEKNFAPFRTKTEIRKNKHTNTKRDLNE